MTVVWCSFHNGWETTRVCNELGSRQNYNIHNFTVIRTECISHWRNTKFNCTVQKNTVTIVPLLKKYIAFKSWLGVWDVNILLYKYIIFLLTSCTGCRPASFHWCEWFDPLLIPRQRFIQDTWKCTLCVVHSNICERRPTHKVYQVHRV